MYIPYIYRRCIDLQVAIIFPFGISVYILCLALQAILGARKAYIGGLILIGLYFTGGLAFCLANKTMEDFYLTTILTVIQGIVFLASLLATNYKKNT